VEEEVLGKAYDGRLMRRLLTYIRPYKVEVVVALVLLFINAALQVIGPLLTQIAIDRYLVPSTKPSHSLIDPYLSSIAIRWAGWSRVSLPTSMPRDVVRRMSPRKRA
jgi:ATP-binding cassette, subfamily B, multidrug efflux pump